MSLPPELAYHSAVAAAAMGSQPIRLTIKPVNSSAAYLQGQEVRLQIPHLANHHLQQKGTYIKFKVYNSGTNTPALGAAGIASLIQRWSIYHGSQLIEDILNYNRLYEMMLTGTVSAESRGSQSFANMAGTQLVANSLAVNAQTNPPLASVTAGNGLFRAGKPLVAGASQTFILPIMSSILGSGNDKYIPLGWLNSPMLVSLTFASNFQDCLYRATGVQADADAIQITDVNLIAECVKVSDEAESVLKRGSPNGVEFSIRQWKTTRDAIPANAQYSTTLMPWRLQSLKTVLFAQYPAINTITRDEGSCIGSRFRNNLATYNLKLNGSMYPTYPISAGDPETYAETVKALTGINDTLYNSSFGSVSYLIDVSGGAANPYGSFFVAINTDSFENYTGSRQIMSGTRIADNNAYFEATYSANTLASTVLLAVEFDAILTLDNTGQFSIRF